MKLFSYKIKARDVIEQIILENYNSYYRPVSYTHLLEIPEDEIRNRRIALGVEEAWAVSYTHLDVYKRQGERISP